MIISNQQARRIAIHCQLLDGRIALPKGKEGVAQVIEKLGYVQIDTINVIERAHHHTLYTRREDYTQKMLHDLQAVDRRIFEYWGHALAYLPIKDYRYFLPRMRSFEDPASKWFKSRLEKYSYLMKPCLERIRTEGPLGAKDFEKRPGAKHGVWWDAKSEKIALELLFWRGELMITERRRFERAYDLTERVLPSDIDTTYPDENELVRFRIRRVLQGLGIAQTREIRFYFHNGETSNLNVVIDEMLADGDLVAVDLKPGNGKAYYALPETMASAGKLRQKVPHLHILSPFDNMVIQRDRLRELFGFDYTLECFVPAPKRKFGYFVLPVLWGEEFVAKFDAKADRKKKTLLVPNFFFEEGFTPSDRFYTALTDRLWKFASFNGCEKIAVAKTSPSKYKAELVGRIGKNR
ncbi:MAG: YcaQ family DNA glycosylase [candidate division Zixibacteria bacterium]|nr:YcaQ family DNA glycosylase [candidate division Zixibacteria bacterium]